MIKKLVISILVLFLLSNLFYTGLANEYPVTDIKGPSVAYSPDMGTYLSVYSSTLGSSPECKYKIYGIYSDKYGKQIGEEIPIDNSDQNGENFSKPIVKYDKIGERFIIVWIKHTSSADEVYCATVVGATPIISKVYSKGIVSGVTALDSPALDVEPVQGSYMIAWEDSKLVDGDSKLVDGDSQPVTGRKIYYQVYTSASGSAPAASGYINSAPGTVFQWHPSISAAYNEYSHKYVFAIAYFEQYKNELSQDKCAVKGQLVTSPDYLPSTIVQSETNLSPETGDPDVSPAIAYDSKNSKYFVVWDTKNGVGTNRAFYGFAFDEYGIAQSLTLKASNDTVQSYPAIAYDSFNKRLLVAFSQVSQEDPAYKNIQGFYIDNGDGYHVGSGVPFSISAPAASTMPSIAYGSRNATLFCVYRETNKIESKTVRPVITAELLGVEGRVNYYKSPGKDLIVYIRTNGNRLQRITKVDGADLTEARTDGNGNSGDYIRIGYVMENPSSYINHYSDEAVAIKASYFSELTGVVLFKFVFDSGQEKQLEVCIMEP